MYAVTGHGVVTVVVSSTTLPAMAGTAVVTVRSRHPGAARTSPIMEVGLERVMRAGNANV